jgi:hypothetical protein
VFPAVRGQCLLRWQVACTRCVRLLRAALGTRPPVRQIVDIGSGLPTLGQVHSVARLIARDTKVVYIDYDPEVLEESRRGMWRF